MRILYQDLAGRSGAQTSYAMLLRAMAAQFPDDLLTVLCANDSLLEPLRAVPNIRVVLFERDALAELRRFKAEVSDVARIAKAERADIIWTSNLGPYVRTGIPQVLMILNSFQVQGWEVARYHPRSRVGLAALRWFCRRSIRCCDAVQVETQVTADCVRRIVGAPSWIEVIPKAVEAEEASSRALVPRQAQELETGLGSCAFTFLFVATCSPHKNHKTVVGAMEILRTKGIRARLVLTATQADLERSCDARLLSSLIKTGHVVPLGWVEKEQLPELYDTCHASLMPSHVEQLTSAHLEAMLWRKPQVSADLPYAHETCGESSLYADPHDPEDWAAKMSAIIEDGILRARLAAAGATRIGAFPKSWEDMARRQRAFLARVAAAKQPAFASARESNLA